MYSHAQWHEVLLLVCVEIGRARNYMFHETTSGMGMVLLHALHGVRVLINENRKTQGLYICAR
jgi:hypothetical protein